jgi:hypothetical protein
MKRGICLLAVLSLVLSLAAAAPEADPPQGKSDKKESARVHYARTYVALAKLDLQMARDVNKRVAETIPPGIVLVLERNLALAELWAKQADAEADGGKIPSDISVEIAAIYLKTAELNYKQALEANRISKMPAEKLERLRLKVELARAGVESVKELDSATPEQIIRFELERLREEVSEIYVRQLKLLDRN